MATKTVLIETEIAFPGLADVMRDFRKGTRAWRSIETAPKDGTHILAWDGDVMTAIKWWPTLGRTGGYWVLVEPCSGGEDNEFVAPTHWMPLPDAPQEDTPDAAR